MKNGAVDKVIEPDGREDETLAEISAMDTNPLDNFGNGSVPANCSITGGACS